MDDMDAFESQVGREALVEAGPSRPVDVDSIVASATGSASVGRWPVVTRWLGSGRMPAPSEGGTSMFSALRIAAAAAIVALFGGFLLVGVVGDPQEGEVPPAAESPAPSPEIQVQLPAAFTGTFGCTTHWKDGQDKNVVVGPVEGGNLVRRETRGETGRFAAEMSDPRLQGDWTVYTSTDEYFWPGVDTNQPLILAPGILHITNEDGSWQMPWGYMALPDAVTEADWDGVGYMTGGRGYAGMTTLFTMEPRNWDDCYCWTSKGMTAESERCTWDIEGLVIDAEIPTPEVPE